MNRLILFPLLLSLLLFGCASLTSPTNKAERTSIKVMTIAMFETGEDPMDWMGEAKLWLEHEKMNQKIQIPGLNFPLYCNEDAHCVLVTDVGPANAAASLMAIGLNPSFDIRETYFLVAGIGGISPNKGTLGTVVWAEWIVNADLNHEIDIRELPENWDYSHFRMGCEEPWCEGWDTGNEVYHLNPTLREWAYQLSKSVELLDSEQAQEYRKEYPDNKTGRQTPAIMKADILSGGTYWHGVIMSKWADWWVKQWTQGNGTYSITSAEDCGTLTALMRLAKEGLIDPDRIMVLRTASNYDQQHPNQQAIESLHSFSGGYQLAIENAYRAGSAVTHHILSNWSKWQKGVPPLE